ncbi:MAG: GNAT family N-acetyltransferase [Desulfovibrionaceae bacterium]
MEIRSATAADVESVLNLQARVVAGLTHPDMLYADDANFYRSIIAGRGQITLACHEERLVGCSVLRFPDVAGADNLGRDIGLSVNDLGRVAHLEAAYFLPEYRGRGLGQVLGRRNLDSAAAHERPLVCSTAWPGNTPSLKNLFTLGFRIRAIAEKYDGKLRFILMHTGLTVSNMGKASILVNALDSTGHEQALKRGLQGTGLKLNGKTVQVVYT